MAAFPALILTNAGVLLQSKVQGGTALELTNIQMGSGQLNGQPIGPLTALIGPDATVPIQGGKAVGQNTYQVSGFFTNGDLQAGFWWREIGVFANDPDNGEILYAYANAGDAGDYIPTVTDQRIEKYIYVSMVLANASSVTVEIPQSDTFIPSSEKGQPGGVAGLDDTGKVPSDQLPDMDFIPNREKGAAGGVAPLGPDGKVPSEYLGTMGGTLLHIVFDESFKGLMYTITGGDERYSGIVPENLHAVHSLLAVNTEYTLSLRYNERDYVFKVNTSDYYTSIYLMAVVTLDIPTQTGTLVYSGEEQAPSWSGYDPSKMTIGGQVNGTNAGVYTATFTPADGYKWPDGSTGQKEARWTIEKATPTLVLNPPTLSLTNGVTTGICTVTTNSEGTLSATSEDEDIATASISDTTVHVTALKNGSTTIGVTVSEGQNYAARTETIYVTASNTILHITVLDLDGSPMSNVQVSGLTGISSEKTYTDKNGKIDVILEPGQYTISVPSFTGCIDVTLSAQSVNLGIGDEKSIVFQLKSPGITQKEFTSSTSIKLSSKVKDFDVFCVGGGGSGAAAAVFDSTSLGSRAGTTGGAGGYTSTKKTITNTGEVIQIVVGSGGQQVTASLSGSLAGLQHNIQKGNDGGETYISIKGSKICSALGGKSGNVSFEDDASGIYLNGSNGGSGSGCVYVGNDVRYDIQTTDGGADGSNGEDYGSIKGGVGQGTTTKPFGESGISYSPAGSGCALGTNDAFAEGTPGANGGKPKSSKSSGTSLTSIASIGTVKGAGGGAALAAIIRTSSASSVTVQATSSAGVSGLAIIRWRYAS